MLDDFPLAPNEVSSSVLLASYVHASIQNGKPASGGGNISTNIEIEKGLLTLFCSDGTGIQVTSMNFLCVEGYIYAFIIARILMGKRYFVYLSRNIIVAQEYFHMNLTWSAINLNFLVCLKRLFDIYNL